MVLFFAYCILLDFELCSLHHVEKGNACTRQKATFLTTFSYDLQRQYCCTLSQLDGVLFYSTTRLLSQHISFRLFAFQSLTIISLGPAAFTESFLSLSPHDTDRRNYSKCCCSGCRNGERTSFFFFFSLCPVHNPIWM